MDMAIVLAVSKSRQGGCSEVQECGNSRIWTEQISDRRKQVLIKRKTKIAGRVGNFDRLVLELGQLLFQFDQKEFSFRMSVSVSTGLCIASLTMLDSSAEQTNILQTSVKSTVFTWHLNVAIQSI